MGIFNKDNNKQSDNKLIDIPIKAVNTVKTIRRLFLVDYENVSDAGIVGVDTLTNNDTVIIFYGSKVKSVAYDSLIAITNSKANIEHLKAEKTAKEYLDDFIAKCPYTQNAQAVEMNVGGDPVGGMTKKLYDDNIMVVGDAAGQVNPLTGGGIISGMTGGMCAGQVAAQAIKEDCSKKFLKQYDKMAHDELDHEIKRYKKVQEYLLTLSDDELNSIAHAFEGESFDKISTTEIVKKLIKVSPKALLKLGKFV